MQTLSKKLLIEDFAPENLLLDSGDFEMDNQELNVTKYSMCGAFIHGLEDEFEIVRTASVLSLRELACNNQDFAQKTIPFLVDMFNDEFLTVRLQAIMAISKIAERWNIVVNTELVQSLILILGDQNPSLQAATFKMLGNLQFENHSNLEAVLEHVFKSKVPNECENVFLSALGNMGMKHASLVEEHFVSKFLKIDKRFATKENRIDDTIRIIV
jgi:integrator complex subunit 4